MIQQKPVIVRIIETPKDTTGLTQLRDVLIGSIGLTGAIVLAAILFGAVIAGVMFWARRRQT